ncbi:MAG: hypothetical protein R3C49_25400 [Planctomycetaceae bacterium]
MSLRVALLLIPFCSSFAADEAEPARWDDKTFGIHVAKPERGRFWTVVHTIPFSEGSKLEEGDEIMELDGERVSLSDDLVAMLRSADDTIELKAKRMVGGKRVIDSAKFSRTTEWEKTLGAFDSRKDELNGWEILSVKSLRDVYSGKSHLLPEVLLKNGNVETAMLRFQYRAKDWLFINQVTIRHGDKTFEIKLDRLTGTKREVLDGGIREWFSVSGSEAEEIIRHIADNHEADSLIRLHGNDYYKDIELSRMERIAFVWASQLWTYGQQRKSDLVKN